MGHKSRDCPKRVDKVSSRDNKSSETTQRNLGVKPGFRPRTANWVAVTSDFPLVHGKVNALSPQIPGLRLQLCREILYTRVRCSQIL